MVESNVIDIMAVADEIVTDSTSNKMDEIFLKAIDTYYNGQARANALENGDPNFKYIKEYMFSDEFQDYFKYLVQSYFDNGMGSVNK